MISLYLFKGLIALHIAFGAPGLLSFWIPILAKKGGARHSYWGRLFAIMMLVTASAAVGMATLTLLFPMETHPHLVHHPDFANPVLVRIVFGWMMLYLAILTINLAWYAWCCASYKTKHERHRHGLNFALQPILLIASANAAYQGYLINQPMVMAFSLVGFATVATNLYFMYKPNPRPIDWLLEHIKGIVGTGISVYTAFFAFGAVRLLPEAALSPVLWSVPLVIGISLILYHQQKVLRRFNRSRSAAKKPAGAAAVAK
ncbi:MAG: hypothetical protein AAGC83_11830 [Pseudomonadota bacterium]